MFTDVSIKLKFLSRKNLAPLSILVIILVYIIFKAYNKGSDIDYYLNASRRLFNGEDIYDSYLYSPLFAILLRPISIFNDGIARIIWGLMNFIITIRLWKIAHSLIIRSIKIDTKLYLWWLIATVFISLGYLNHNLILGQTTILILWLTFSRRNGSISESSFKPAYPILM
ncbi:glycosyltransferase 87 family protein [Bacteroidota bacterium]